MSDRQDDNGKPAEERTVGYGHPPLHSRFRPGQSGNSRGRPKGRRSKQSIFQDVMGEKITVSVNGRRKRVTVEVAILLRMREQALKGDIKSARLLLDLHRSNLGDDEADGTDRPLSQEDMEILASAGLLPSPEDGDDPA